MKNIKERDLERAYRKGLRTERDRIISLIDKDIEIQKKYLSGDFIGDRAQKWRIVGMNSLKNVINAIPEEVKRR